QGYIEIEVEDRGIGIDSHSFNSVFVPFFRAENPDTKKESGTGPGLSVVKTLIELHGGRVNIDSKIGRGTIVRFSVPGAIIAPEDLFADSTD
ncbi:MAG: ATP-binding protein, partial [Dehalococcoidia bacterium]